MFKLITDSTILFIQALLLKYGLLILAIASILGIYYIIYSFTTTPEQNSYWIDIPINQPKSYLIKKCKDNVYRYVICRELKCDYYKLCTSVEHAKIKADEVLKTA